MSDWDSQYCVDCGDRIVEGRCACQPGKPAHDIRYEPQPIADQWMAKCSCGWRDTVSYYDVSSRDEMRHKLRRLARQHLNEVENV